MGDFSIIDTFWVFLAAILVFFMNLGFAAVEAGFARSKNTVNILSKNFIVFAVSSIGYLLLGWGLMFGGDNPFIGTKSLFILGSSDNSFYDNTLTSSVPFWGKVFFQMVFCGTAATIVSGAVAERIKYVSFIIFSFVLTIIIYPIIGHWIWGGGWLAKLGFQDFAGDTVVHSVGGWAALSGALILGPRIGKYGKDGKPRAIPGHNMSLAVIGLFVLWLGWFGFNPGSTMSFQNPSDVMHILFTTNASAVAAVLTSTITSWIVIGKPDLGMTVNGCLAGLVGITASCAYVSIPVSLLIGAVAGVIVVLLVGFFDRLGIVAVGAFVFAAASLTWFILKKTIGIRVTAKEEIAGLDIGEHGNIAYPDFALVTEMSDYDDEAPTEASDAPAKVPVNEAVVVEHHEAIDSGISKATIIMNQSKFSQLQDALESIGITGMTVTNVFGYGVQKGHKAFFRGAPIETRLLPKIKIDVVISKIPVNTLVTTVQKVLYTGNIGDGKIFIYDVRDVVKVRTGEHGFDALQDEEK